MTEEQNPTPGDDETLVTPEEHAEASESVEPGQDVSDPGVPDDVEIAARSADMEKPSRTHTKQFVLGPGSDPTAKGNPYTAARGFDHEPNKAATRQYAIDNGLWPTEDVEFVSGKKHADGVSWILTYSVEVIPAHTAEDGAQSPRVVGSDGADVADDAEEGSAAVLATGATNYLPPEAVEAHDDNTPTE